MSVKNSKKPLTFLPDADIVSEVKQSRTAVLTSIHEEEVNNGSAKGMSAFLFCCDLLGTVFLPFLFQFFGRCFSISTQEHQINEEIRDKEVRLIDSDGSQLGIVTIQVAMDKAAERNLDLVKIAPKAEPPVCRVMDYGKFRFEQMKKEKEAKKNQHVVEIKEIRMSPGIDTNDLNTKIKAAQKFLTDGNRVKVSIRFRGREMAHTNIGEKILLDFADACAEIASMEKNPKLEGRFMAMFLTPKNSK